jgi:predicted nucleotidyltransferase
MERRAACDRIRDKYGLLALYLFGSRADDGLRLLRGEPIDSSGSDIDVGVVSLHGEPGPLELGDMQSELSDVFSPLTVDLVALQKLDPLFQFRAVDGHRISVSDRHRADIFELEVMRRAAELLPVQRRIERDLFGASTS